MAELQRGLYEQLIDAALDDRLRRLDQSLEIERRRLHPEEAADRLSLHLGRLLRRAVESLDSSRRVTLGLNLARRIVSLLEEEFPDTGIDDADHLADVGDIVLSALLARLPDGRLESPVLPVTPLLDTTLLTNAPGEPRIGLQVKTEIPSADRIDVLMAFVRQTGIRPLLDTLKHHCESGRRLRLLTTTYTNSTELAALEALQAIGADVRVSYDTSGTRLHAKAWLFHRASGFSTAYIGSSNLTHSAQVSGLEWNVRLAGARNPDVINKFSAVFDSYWASDDFRVFDADEFHKLSQTSSRGPRIFLSPVELRPEPFQSRLLEQVELSRVRGFHRNLLVSATGTGKTVMAALDYQRLRGRLPRARLLFVAHRKEILEQSLATFRHALRDAAFGELWVGNHRPTAFDYVFASIQSLTASGLQSLASDHFDVVVVDEFHHAAANTYNALLSHLQPRELLGLTATPERGDGLPILQWFSHRIAAELRLWDAIEQQRLCPFDYYGLSDGVDLTRVTWRRGSGYDMTEIEQLVTGNDALARLIIARVCDHVSNPQDMRALGFCVSVRHAEFMARKFVSSGLSAVAVSSTTPNDQREDALRQLESGSICAVFAVDLFNEGVDLPSVDTLLFLRPTDSATIFLQQLGRGLRRKEGKAVCTVLDFVAQHRKEFQFQRRLGALLRGSRKKLIEQVKGGFPFLPSGCQMQLDSVATNVILQNLRESLPSTWRAKTYELRRVAEESDPISLKRFLDETGLALEDIYSDTHCWSRLLQDGGIPVLPDGPNEMALRRALGRLLHVDDLDRIRAYRQFAVSVNPPNLRTLDLRTRRLFHMLVAILLESVAPIPTLDDAAVLLWQHPQILAELAELMDVLEDRIDHIQAPLNTHQDTPLYVHARYTRREILASFADGSALSLPTWREGVRWLPDERVDLLAFTLDKSSGQFSPTTRYRDYAINRQLIHWESQSTTREESGTGMRYQSYQEADGAALLFGRLEQSERAFWFLGSATYVSHEGERPMAVQWKLKNELPGDLFAQFAAAVA